MATEKRVRLVRLEPVAGQPTLTDEVFTFPSKVSLVRQSYPVPVATSGGSVEDVATSSILVEGQWITGIRGSSREVEELLSGPDARDFRAADAETAGETRPAGR